MDNCVIICQGCSPRIKNIKDNANVIKTKVESKPMNKKRFKDKWDIKTKGNKWVLYKSTQENDTDFYTGRVSYIAGEETVCKDWDKDKNRECGGGLHLCPHPEQALAFDDGKLKRCLVDPKDIIVCPNPQYPTKVRCKKVFVVEDIKL